MTTGLDRTALSGGRRPPVRIVHLGLGAFHRSHQAWYTAKAADAADWGIAAYTGRRPDAARALAAQDGVYMLVERSADHDRCEAVGSIVRAVPGDDVDDFAATLADPGVSVLTLTITENGYRLDAEGLPDFTDPEVAADGDLLRRLLSGADPAARPRTALGRVLYGLARRRRAGAPPIAIVPCDNLPDNGRATAKALTAFADAVSPELAADLPDLAAFVSTSVDRITPRTAKSDLDLVRRATGRTDRAPVVAEPFSDWVLCGEFPSGRPAWETAGARFVNDIGPWESRKLWMLNGAHTLLAASGTLRGHRTVAEAVADPVCRAQVDALWDEAARHLPPTGLDDYRSALLERFANPRIEHRLAQIAEDSATKIGLRIVPIARRERAAGRSARACAAALAAWVLAEGRDPAQSAADLAADGDFAAEIAQAVETMQAHSTQKAEARR